MHLTILFNRSIITIILMQSFSQKSRLTGKSIIKSIEIWTHLLSGTGKSLKKAWYLFFDVYFYFYTHNNFWRNVWRHLLSQANNNNGSEFRMFLFYLGALHLGHSEIFGQNDILIEQYQVRTFYPWKKFGRQLIWFPIILFFNVRWFVFNAFRFFLCFFGFWICSPNCIVYSRKEFWKRFVVN